MANTGNTQQQIDYGAAANDGTGDPLRTAFIKTDDNFDNIWLAGPVGSNITIVNNTVQANDTNGNLILSPNGVGVIQTNSKLLPRLNNTYDLGSTTLKYRAGYFGAGGLTVDGNVAITGNLTAGNISYTSNVFVGDLQGSVFADDSTIMVDAIDNALYAGRAAISGNVSATYFIGNGSQLTGLAATYGNANVVANLAALGSNPVSTTGNVTASYFIGNGRSLTGITSSYGNANVVANLAALGSNPVSTTGNVTASYFIGNGSLLTGLPAPAVTQDITSNGAMSIMTYDGVIKYVSYATVEPSSGNLTAGNVSSTGNITAGNLIATGNIVLTGSLIGSGASPSPSLSGFSSVSAVTVSASGNVTSGNVLTAGIVSATGNISGNYFIGNGSQLTGISSGIQSSIANGTSNVSIATANGNATITANTVTYTFGTNSTLTLPGGSQISPLGANLDIIAGTGAYVNLITADESSSVGVDNGGGYVVTAGGTWDFDTTGNLTAPGNISAVGNITGGNLITTGSGGAITMSGGNITGAGNISAGNVSTTGNVTAANFFGNGNTLSNVATQIAGSWTVPVGNNTQSFTVPINNTYQLWVRGNIPNGIIVYNATVSVSNTNVPVIGQQFAWNYEGGGNLLMFTSIPAQIVGTAGTISNAAPAVANTNVFTFGINNTSGNTVTVNYGYTKIS